MKIKLTKKQAAMLRGMVQNPVRPDETPEERALRKYIWDSTAPRTDEIEALKEEIRALTKAKMAEPPRRSAAEEARISREITEYQLRLKGYEEI